MLKIYSDNAKIDQLLFQLNELKIEYRLMGDNFDPKTQLNEEETFIFCLSNLDSKFFQSVISIQNVSPSNCLFVLTSNKEILNELLLKIGFQNIFIYPEFKGKLEFALRDAGLFGDQAINLKDENDDNFSGILGESDELSKALKLAKAAVLNPNMNVLILGETGTGKSLVAESIHNSSANSRNAPFVEVTCTSFSEPDLETELWGIEKNIGNNKNQNKTGLFELANGGTIFLDEIGNLSQDLQTKLLKVIEKKVIRKIGGSKDIPLNLRIISSSNKDIQNLVQSSQFRADLFYRLTGIKIVLPPLRMRGNDILILVNYFNNKFSVKHKKKPKKINKELEEALKNYTWPGNIRELRHAVERATILSNIDNFTLEDFGFAGPNFIPEYPEQGDAISDKKIRMDIDYINVDLKSLNRIYAKKVLVKMNGSKIKTAQTLNISRPKLDKLLDNNLNDTN